MARFNKKIKLSGQALVEMVLVLPLLFLLIAGAIQFTILFQARTAFDKACGEAARQYSAGKLTNSLFITNAIWNDMGSFQSYFVKSSLNIVTQTPEASIADTFFNSFDALGPWAQKVKSYFINYTGQTWTITINCIPPSLVAIMFPAGIPFQCQLTVLKYPS